MLRMVDLFSESINKSRVLALVLHVLLKLKQDALAGHW